MLTDTKLKSLKPRDKQYRLSDGNGLYIEIRPNGSKYWRQAYRFNGRQKTLAHGIYPIISLAEARTRRYAALRSLAKDQDPAKVKRREKSATKRRAY